MMDNPFTSFTGLWLPNGGSIGKNKRLIKFASKDLNSLLNVVFECCELCDIAHNAKQNRLNKLIPTGKVTAYRKQPIHNIGISIMSTKTIAPKFDLGLVNTADKTSAIIVQAKGTMKKANYEYHLACMGSAYQVVISGNRNQVKELLDSLGKKSQRYQKILECLRELTGNMLTITEDKQEIVFDYNFDLETKMALLGDTSADDWAIENTKWYALAQKPWFEYELAKEDYGFDAGKIATSAASNAKKGALGGMTLEAIIASVESGFADGLKEKQEKAEADKLALQQSLANSTDVDFINSYAASIVIPDGETSMTNEVELVKSAFAAGDITKVAALTRLGTVEENAKVEFAAIAERLAAEGATETDTPVVDVPVTDVEVAA